MKFLNQITNKTVHFFVNETVIYIGKEKGKVFSDTTVQLKDGTILYNLQTQTHKFKLKYPLPLFIRVLGLRL